MAFLFKWMVRLVSAALVLAGLALAFTYYLASRSLPDYDVTRSVNGVSAEVDIVRNNANIPHVFGSSDADVYFGLGYAHAQDRLWQMVTMRRTVQGRLSEMFGARTLKTDELMRRLDLYRLARESVEDQDAETTAALEAYARGVNAWLDRVNDEALGRGAPEFFLFDNAISPWVPADSIAIMKLMGVQLAGHLEEEVLRARVSLALDEKQVSDILPDMPGNGVAALPDYASLFPDQPGATQYAAYDTTPEDAFMYPAPPRGLAGASNAWAAAPDRSAAGGTLLANDPHLGFTAPTIWYLARMELASGAVIGATIPGMPAILIGRSADFAWGLTSSYLDDQDVFIEKVNPENTGEVQTPDGWAALTERASIIRVRDAAPVTITLRWSENGPVLPGTHFNLGSVTPAGHVAALGWTLLNGDDTSMTAAMNLMQAKSVTQGIAAGRDFVAPSQNVTMIDRDTIALKTIGEMPRRDAEHMTFGRLPAPGWRAENRWIGREAYAANPQFVAPSGGIVGNTNNKLLDRPFPLHVSYEWGDSQRIQRWQFLMQNREVHTRESFIEAQLDTVSITARNLLPLVGADLWFTGEAAPEGTTERKRQQALDLLANWNGEMNEHLPEPLIYMAWMRALQNRLIRDELGPLAGAFNHLEPIFIERVYRDIQGAGDWCDVVQSAPTETCTQIARESLDDALLWIDEHFGGSYESLRWGDAHEATHDHQVLGDLPVLKWFVNIRQSTSGGDNTLMRGRTSGREPDPFLNVHGAGYRGVYDFADPDSSLFISSTGQSGHFLSRHYDDLGDLWRRGEYVPMSLDPELARAASVGTTRLLPRTP
ncbi:penicillin acylase family protein [Maritimibacter sp. UBA3975]|uniref:penicillin acylase family protein n=1 Tax=Maritimibacter sp. UBA3975 TaxID=1946833 RepID=UPI000C0AFE4E|nr:penicillin acylase family protein [Maritimibacter sp. UBA3975]MAM60162.1 penicillin acylase family protein [Maritimibacter sp.]|tara:strand:- start:20037 stop:22514 length:2478 start_codon:yes stop_codon:yes gene_type:complete